MFIEKQLENSGKTIAEVKQLKSKMKIVFTDDTSISLDINSYLNEEKFYKGKIISNEYYKHLCELQDDSLLFAYVTKIISIRLYSSYTVKEKLINVKKIDAKRADKVVERFVKSGLLNDELYVQSYINDAILKGFSKKKIEVNLLKEGFHENDFISFLSDIDCADNKVEITENLFSKYSYKNFYACKDSVFIALYRKGYDYDECNRMIEKFIANNEDVVEELKLKDRDYLKAEMNKYIEKYRRMNLEEYEVKNKTINALINHKFGFDDIIKMWEELK